MFDLSFGKLVIIFTLCLIVLGPEKLPKLAQQLGRIAGQARAMARHFRMQLEQEIAESELTKQRQEFESAMRSGADAVKAPLDTVAQTAQDAAQQVKPAVDFASANNSGHGEYNPDPPASETSERSAAPGAETKPPA